MSPTPELSKIGAIQARAFFWGFTQTIDANTKRKLILRLASEKVSSEQIRRITKGIKERQAIQVLLERIVDYASKREAALEMFKRTRARKWYKQWIFYKGEFEKVSQSLAKIYLERRKRVLALEREFRFLFAKCADCGKSSNGSVRCRDCSQRRIDAYVNKAKSK